MSKKRSKIAMGSPLSSRRIIGATTYPSISFQLTVFFTIAAILAASAAVNCISAKAVGHMARRGSG
jgi:hypothetical protein